MKLPKNTMMSLGFLTIALTSYSADTCTSDYSGLCRHDKIAIVQVFVDLDGCKAELAATDSLNKLQANHLAFYDAAIEQKNRVILDLEAGNSEQSAATQAANSLYILEKKKGRRTVVKAATAGTLTSVATLGIGFIIGIFYHH
jgi:hypothetical protein